MDTAKLIQELKEILKGEIVSDEKTLALYSHDTSLFEIKPQIVVFPLNVGDIKTLVSFVKKNKNKYPKLSITARSGGTDMTGGAINDSIILDFSKHLNNMGEVNPEGTIVEPGVFYRDFEKQTLKKGLYLPSYPASKNICGIGGMIANNAGGEKTLAHGKTIDYVLELKVVLSDGQEYIFKKISKNDLAQKIKQDNFEGEIYKKIYKLVTENQEIIQNAKPKVSKNSTGYNLWDVWDGVNFDLTKLFVGSQGTLGMLTEAKIKLIEKKKHSGLLVIYLNDIKILPHLIGDVLSQHPESFEAFDAYTLKLAIRFMPQFIQILGLKGTISMGMQFLPTLFSFAFKSLPKFTLLVEFDADKQEEINERVENLRTKIADYPIKTVLAEKDKEAENYWTIRRESFNLLRKNVKNKHTAPFIDDLIVRPEYLVDFFPKLTAILEKHKLEYTIAGHMGDGNFHIIPLMDFSKRAEVDKIPVIEDEVNQLVLSFGGSISAEHNEGLVRGHYIKKMYGEKVFGFFKQVKAIFDPNNIFNPHKKTDASQSYSLAHIREKF